MSFLKVLKKHFVEDFIQKDITEVPDFIPTFITPTSAAFNAQMFYLTCWCHPVDTNAKQQKKTHFHKINLEAL